MSVLDKETTEPILYELLEYFFHKQDPELIKCRNDATILLTTGTIKNALRYLNNRYSFPESVSQQVSLTSPWKFAVGDSGRLLAILQENVIEIRKAKDEYSSIAGKASVPKDAFPHWRKLAWSPDGTILVLASSNGYVSFYNSLGNNIFNISPKTMSNNPQILEAGDAIASMMFLEPSRKDERWSYEFILVTYSGLLKCYCISLTNGYNASYEFSFSNFYRNGINAVTYDHKHNLFYVAGNTIAQKLTSKAAETGLTSWRPLTDYPYCKLSFTFDESEKPSASFSIWNIIPTLRFQGESIIFNMKISPSNELLACLHTDGSVSLWRLPNLILQQKWKLSEQPDFNIPNPLRTVKCRKFPPGLTEYHPLDIGWWSDQAIIIARYCGSTSVCSVRNLRNLLGNSPEFLAGQPQIVELCANRGFLCLDCETVVTSKKRSRETNPEAQLVSEASSESDREDDEIESMTVLNYIMSWLQSKLYLITDIERFQPKRKKSKILHRTYRVLGLKSTTPEELYSRKIDIEEYEEALALANAYNLDTDLVYQTQWRKSELSLNAIQEHLSKVSKRSWVLNECITRVPDTIEAARELLNFGLKGANLETLLAIGVYDTGKFIESDTYEDSKELGGRAAHLRQVEKANRMIEQLDTKNLSEAQKDLLYYRRKLLDHLDKLLTYEVILQAPLTYDKNFYEEFRRRSAVENAMRFAKNGDCRGVEIMFMYYGEKLFPHWLAIISFFPETLSPRSYEKLLPECDTQGELFLLDQRELRQKDWSERSEFAEVFYMENEDKSDMLYDCDASLLEYRNAQLTQKLLQKWYTWRAYQIERNSFIVDNALQLIKIGKSHNIAGLEDLLLDLETLDDLVYRVYLENISLDQLEKLSSLEKIKLLMSTSDESNFVSNIQNLLLPFIKRRQRYFGGETEQETRLLRDYLICLSKESLRLPVKFFEYLKQTHATDIMEMIDDVAALAFECIYACTDPDAIEDAKRILDSIPRDINTSNSLEELQKEIDCAKLLKKYDVRTTLSYLRKKKNCPESVKLLLIQMARSLNKLVPSPDEKQWAQLLNEMLELHGSIFSCVDVELCFETCVSARLVSGMKSNIRSCSALIETKKAERSLLKVSYEKAVALILDASREYFNSSKSLTDPNMDLAKTCLRLIEDDNAQIKEEYDLITSLQILNEFGVETLPFQVRLTQDRLVLIEECLNVRQEAYKSRQRLLTLANCLRIEEGNSKAREGKVLELVARRAFEVQDYNNCAVICQQLMQNTYIGAWAIALKLGYCDEFQDLKVRQKCLWFAINNGPNEILCEALDRMHLIEIQILHKNLELWIPSPDSSESFERDVDSEDEFIDAMSTPQIESRDFVPRVFETSTELVKTSANIVKESAFGVVKQISDANFWKRSLRLAFPDSAKDDVYYENSRREKDANLQSFPCFYESLHEKCNIGGLAMRYDKYSMPDVDNVKLKCCRALLRIALLTESSCYDAPEANDIAHLFLECARHTISEDWPLALAYLLSLDSTRLLDIQKLFMDLPKSELHVQTALYYYSLTLHKKLEMPFKDLYSYDPLSLINKMLTVTYPNSDECEIREALLYWQTFLQDSSKGEGRKNEELFTLPDRMRQQDSVESASCKMLSSIARTQVANDDNDFTTSAEDKNRAQDVSFMCDSVNPEWTNDWGNFSDDDKERDFKDYVSTVSEEVGNDDKELVERTLISEADRFEAFQKAFKKIQCKKQYEETKMMLLQWPRFTKPEFTRVEVHPIIKMMELACAYITKKNTENFTNQMFLEYRQLSEAIAPTDFQALQQLLKDKNSNIPEELKIYVLLCTDDSELHNDALDAIKERYQSTTLSPVILETIFWKNLTARFHPNHSVYKQIIEHMFTNHSRLNIEENAIYLIKELQRQRHIADALNIIARMEHMPPSLKTFGICFSLLTEK